MSTTIVTIVISVIATLLIISLSLMTWVIVNLKRRISDLESLGLTSAEQFQNIYREFENVGRDHDQKIKEVKIQLGNEMQGVYQSIKDVEIQLGNEMQGVYQSIKDVENDFEKKLDKRFENAYQKIKRLTEK
jgi:predicted PurR-regulated permease PerM